MQINAHMHKIPGGTQDFLPEECYHKRELENAFRTLLRSWGYDEVQTPILEFYEGAQGVGTVACEQMQKLIDNQGNVLILRPDNTLPLARLRATKLPVGTPSRLFCVQDIFAHGGQNTSRQCPQMGAELMGESSAAADAQIIALAITSLKEAGLVDFQIELGQVEFFKGLMEEANLSPQDAEDLRACVEQKNMLGMEMIKTLPAKLRECMMSLPTLYGGKEALERAHQVSTHPLCQAALQNLEDIMEILSQEGLADYVSVDLGMVHAIHYYSGVIFRGITPSLGQSILSGGRYDGLLAGFGTPLPATGFALDTKQLLVALEKQGIWKEIPQLDVLLSAGEGTHPPLHEKAQSLRANGLRVAICHETGKHTVIMSAQTQGAKEAIIYEKGLWQTIWKA